MKSRGGNAGHSRCVLALVRWERALLTLGREGALLRLDLDLPRRLLNLRPRRRDVAPLGGALADREADGVASGDPGLREVRLPAIVDAVEESLVQAVQACLV